MPERYRGSFLPSVFGGVVPVTICNDCGALVLDTDQHDIFHVYLEDIATKAQEGANASYMLGPIGG